MKLSTLDLVSSHLPWDSLSFTVDAALPTKASEPDGPTDPVFPLKYADAKYAKDRTTDCFTAVFVSMCC